MASSNNGTAVYQGLLARGFGPAQAAALAGNAQQESSFSPTAWNSTSSAGGLMQWRGSRLAGLMNFANANGQSPGDLDTQLDYIKAEMAGPEAASAAPFMAATDVPSANAALKGYLRYGPTEGGNRLQYSQAFAGQTQASGGQNVAQAKSNTSAALDAIFNTPAANAAPTAADPVTNSALDAIFGPSPTGDAAPGTPAYAAKIQSLVNAGQSTPQPLEPPPEWQPPPDVMPAPLRAFSTNAVESVPVLGPLAHDVRNAMPGASPGQMDATDAEAAADAPGAALAGKVFGTVAPLAAAGTTAVGARLLGMSGGLASRIGFGMLSGGGLSGANSLVSGDSPETVGTNSLIGGAVGAAAPIVIGKIAQGVRSAVMGPTAERTMANALTADQVSPANVNHLVQQMGPGALPADIGPNTQHLAGALASLPGEPQTVVRNALTARAAGAGQRLASDVSTNLGNGQPIGALTDQIIASQKAAAAPLYAAVDPLPVTMTPALKALQATPLGQQAFQTAATMMANDGKAGTGVTVGFLDAAKQALDDVTSSSLRAGNNNAARQASNMAATLRAEVDAQVPGYAAARDAFAGPAAVLDAISQGQQLFTKSMSPEELQAGLAGMSQSEKDGMLQGAQSAVQSMMGNARNDAAGVKAAFQSSNAKEKLALLVGPDQAAAISDALDREANFSRTNNVAIGNSESAARLAAQRSINPLLAAVPSAPPPQTWQGMAFAGLEKARSALTSTYRNEQNLKLANMLTRPAWSRATIAQAANPGNALIAPASAAAAAAQPGQNQNLLTWAQNVDPALLPAGGGPQAPVRIVVHGAAAQ